MEEKVELLEFENLSIDEEKDESCEVSSITEHKKTKNKYEFQIKFKNYSEQSWVEDKDCDCEEKIKKYFKDNNLDVKTIYCISRVSTKNQVGFNHVSLEAQESLLEKKAQEIIGKKKNYRLKFISISASAYKDIPQKLISVGENADSGDIILVYRVDRLSRNIVKYLSFLEDLNERQISIYALDENLWYDKNKLDFIQGIVDANKESFLIGKRIRMSIARRKERGDEVFGSLPFGYSSKRENNYKLVRMKCLKEQRIIDKIHIMFNDGETYETIASHFNLKGMLKRGKLWNKNMVRAILKKEN